MNILHLKYAVSVAEYGSINKAAEELFEKLEFMKSFGSMAKKTEEKLGIWYLMHRLDELDDEE